MKGKYLKVLTNHSEYRPLRGILGKALHFDQVSLVVLTSIHATISVSLDPNREITIIGLKKMASTPTKTLCIDLHLISRCNCDSNNDIS
jgi:hypothetical protein